MLLVVLKNFVKSLMNVYYVPHADVFEVKYKNTQDDQKRKACNKNMGDKP
jgi:hypothetical protein